MRLHYAILAIAAILLIALSGCKNTGIVVEENAADNKTTEAAEEQTEPTEPTGPVDVKALLKNLSQEAGLPTEESVAENETAEISAGTIYDIAIENFRGNPDDLTIKVGDTIVWTNLMDNFKQAILILPKKANSTAYQTNEINDVVFINKNEKYNYTFNQAGSFKWGSKTKFDKINGIITVIE